LPCGSFADNFIWIFLRKSGRACKWAGQGYQQMIKTLFSGDKLSNVQDMNYGWQEASKTAMALDLTSGSITGWQMYQIAKEN
jgi:hypothetical protein